MEHELYAKWGLSDLRGEDLETLTKAIESGEPFRAYIETRESFVYAAVDRATTNGDITIEAEKHMDSLEDGDIIEDALWDLYGDIIDADHHDAMVDAAYEAGCEDTVYARGVFRGEDGATISDVLRVLDELENEVEKKSDVMYEEIKTVVKGYMIEHGLGF